MSINKNIVSDFPDSITRFTDGFPDIARRIWARAKSLLEKRDARQFCGGWLGDYSFVDYDIQRGGFLVQISAV